MIQVFCFQLLLPRLSRLRRWKIWFLMILSFDFERFLRLSKVESDRGWNCKQVLWMKFIGGCEKPHKLSTVGVKAVIKRKLSSVGSCWKFSKVFLWEIVWFMIVCNEGKVSVIHLNLACFYNIIKYVWSKATELRIKPTFWKAYLAKERQSFEKEIS